MANKTRTKSKELIILESLNNRGNLTKKDKQRYFNMKKGFAGEAQFDAYTEKLQNECSILNDLLLEVNGTTFQIDSLIIIQGKIYMYEVKNYEGDYYYESDRLYKIPKIEVINPLHQLSRTESLLRQLLLSLGFKPQINAFLVFINPSFTLYQAPLDKPFIFPNQLERHIKTLNATPSKLTERHKLVADQLLSLNITDTSFKQIPAYEYDQLKKGITCPQCHTLDVAVMKRACVCRKCGYNESTTNAVLRSINEYKTLFPNEKITTKTVYDWCRVIPSKKTIRNILANNFKVIGNNKWSYYE